MEEQLVPVGEGTSGSDFDYASVQRANPEMERRCQEVIDRCWLRGPDNPIVFIHDVGAGGLSNALPELVKDGVWALISRWIGFRRPIHRYLR